MRVMSSPLMRSLMAGSMCGMLSVPAVFVSSIRLMPAAMPAAVRLIAVSSMPVLRVRVCVRVLLCLSCLSFGRLALLDLLLRCCE